MEMLIRKPDDSQASQFALMIHVGLSPKEAILYFLDPDLASDPSVVVAYTNLWVRSPKVQKELETHRGGKWETMTLDQRIKASLDKHYAEKAYFLFSHNFSELTGQELSKAQEARKVLEAKLAGTSGALDPLNQFFVDLKEGRVKLDARQKAADPLSLTPN